MSVSVNSMTYDRDSGHKSFLEDVFENVSRLPGGSWGPSSVPWTDVVSIELHWNPDFSNTQVFEPITQTTGHFPSLSQEM